MTELDLEANGTEQERILAYLQENASDVLAEKINNGTPFEKDGKQLLNKKTLSGFMKFACDEARKQAVQGANAACIDDPVVFGWAVHYFEEESIEGTLYNEDGTEYEPPKPVKKVNATPVVPYTPPAPAPKPQMSIFDMFDEKPKTETKPAAITQESVTPAVKPNVNPTYERYLKIQEKYPDCVIAYRLGDFCEIYGENAKKIADELNMTLTGRDFGLAERIPMIGIPYHAIDAYIAKLINKGYKLNIAEPLDGDNVSERIIAPEPPQDDDDDFYDDLTEEEMRKFDGDISEAYEPAEQADDNDDFDLTTEKERLKAFDTEALCILGELFDNEIEIQ